MLNTPEQIFSAMAEIVEAPGYPLLQHYKQDFYTHDKQLLQSWHSDAKAIWVVTPNGTHLQFIGNHERQVEKVNAIVDTLYQHVDIFFLKPTGITRITKMQAVEEAKKLKFNVSPGGHVTNSHGALVATMSIHQIGDLRRRNTNVHYEPGIAFTGSSSQLAALRDIAIEASICEVQTLFMAVERITVGDSLWTKKGLVKVQCNPDDQFKSVVFSKAELMNGAKGFYSKQQRWTTLQNAAQFESQNARIQLPIGSQIITLKEARFIVAQEESCPLLSDH